MSKEISFEQFHTLQHHRHERLVQVFYTRRHSNDQHMFHVFFSGQASVRYIEHLCQMFELSTEVFTSLKPFDKQFQYSKSDVTIDSQEQKTVNLYAMFEICFSIRRNSLTFGPMVENIFQHRSSSLFRMPYTSSKLWIFPNMKIQFRDGINFQERHTFGNSTYSDSSIVAEFPFRSLTLLLAEPNTMSAHCSKHT